ncbi:MAG: hypothetical protein HY473_01130 [Candidatus Sungbacteria bacterium]|uniref:Uncharacterized protein n=1 Tax=Candidatus Sungiibacteriota bacterium TaxID=2750080 RepID=A0A933DTH9_9BACT|nr:hypothetical protein [Candidatus Sungbacteria bacterium]
MNPLGIFSIIVAIVVGFFGLSATDFGTFGGGGPIATGPGSYGVRNPQPVSRGGSYFAPSPQESVTPVALKPGESPYKGKVRISTVERFGDRPEQEYVIIRYSGGFFGSSQDQPIRMSGWRIGSDRASEVIPQAFEIPEIDAVERDIILPPGGELIVVTGTPTYQRNFRENTCVGYFNESHAFTPFLSSSCADQPEDRGDLLRRGFSGACIDAIRDIPECRQNRKPLFAGIIGQDCADYIAKNFSYVACVRDFRDSRDFLKNTWRVSLKRSQKLFDPRHDRAILRDRQGLLVDEFEY